MSYLSAEAQKHGTSEFDIPFSRQQLADYLSVERSAMSTELGKLRDEGMLFFPEESFFALEQRCIFIIEENALLRNCTEFKT